MNFPTKDLIAEGLEFEILESNLFVSENEGYAAPAIDLACLITDAVIRPCRFNSAME